MYVLWCGERIVRKHRECIRCGRPIPTGDPATAVVRLSYTGSRTNEVWTEYTCATHPFRWFKRRCRRY